MAAQSHIFLKIMLSICVAGWGYHTIGETSGRPWLLFSSSWLPTSRTSSRRSTSSPYVPRSVSIWLLFSIPNRVYCYFWESKSILEKEGRFDICYFNHLFFSGCDDIQCIYNLRGHLPTHRELLWRALLWTRPLPSYLWQLSFHGPEILDGENPAYCFFLDDQLLVWRGTQGHGHENHQLLGQH